MEANLDIIVKLLGALSFVGGLFYAVFRFAISQYEKTKKKLEAKEQELETFKQEKQKEAVTEIKEDVEKWHKQIEALVKKYNTTETRLANIEKMMRGLQEYQKETWTRMSGLESSHKNLTKAYHYLDKKIEKKAIGDVYQTQDGSVMIKLGEHTFMLKSPKKSG